MSSNLGEAILYLGTDQTKYDKGLKTAKDKAARLGETFKSAGRTMTLAVTLPVVAFGVSAVKAAGDFEYGMNRVKAVSGATEQQFAQLTAQAKELGATTMFSASEAAAGMGFLAQAGFDANQVIAAMPSTLSLAAAGQLALADAADIASNVLTGYRLNVDQMNRVNDVLVATSTRTNTNVRQMGEAMVYASSVSAGAGLEFEQASAAIGLMGNAGIQASMAGTALRGAITRMLDPTTKAEKAMREAGLSFSDAKGRLLGLDQIIRQLEPHAEDTALMMRIFGLRAGPGMGALVAQGSDALVRLTEELRNSAGEAARIAEVQMAGFNGALKAMRSAFEGLQIAIGESGLLEFLTRLVQGLTKAFRWMTKLNPAVLAIGTALAALAAAAGPVLWAIGALAGALAPTGTLMLGLGLVVTILTGPVGITVALAAAGAALVAWGSQNDAVVGAAVSLWDWAKQEFYDWHESMTEKQAEEQQKRLELHAKNTAELRALWTWFWKGTTVDEKVIDSWRSINKWWTNSIATLSEVGREHRVLELISEHAAKAELPVANLDEALAGVGLTLKEKTAPALRRLPGPIEKATKQLNVFGQEDLESSRPPGMDETKSTAGRSYR